MPKGTKPKKGCHVCRAIGLGYHAWYDHHHYSIGGIRRYSLGNGRWGEYLVPGKFSAKQVAEIMAEMEAKRGISQTP